MTEQLRHTIENGGEVENRWHLEKVPPYLQRFGYEESSLLLAENMHELVARGIDKLAPESVSLYGELTTAYMFNTKRASELRSVSNTLGGRGHSADLDKTVRLGIGIDFAKHFPTDLTYPATADWRFTYSLYSLNNHSLADLVRVAKTEDLANVHELCLDLAKAEAEGEIFRLDREGTHPLAEKYFPVPEYKNELRTYKGFLDFHSETGTEGGYWAFQDEQYTGIPNDVEVCEHCRLGKEYVARLISDDMPEDVDDWWKERRKADKEKMCEPGNHKWVLAYPGGTWSYEGLHILDDGDEVTIFDKADSEKVAWEGKIDLNQHSLFTEHASGWWIHADQEGVDRETWARWFFEENPAKLITWEKVERE